MRSVVLLIGVGLAFFGGPFPSAAGPETPSSPPFQVGERLIYDVSWLNILGGTAVMDVANIGGAADHKVGILITTAQSSPVITKFYPVDNRVESVVDLGNFQTARLLFRRREGKQKEDFEYTFDHKEGTVLAVKNGAAETLTIPPGTLDIISCLYYVRAMMPLKPGSSQALNIHHDKKNYKLEVRVEELETVEGLWGKAETARVLVIMPFQGIFLNKGNIKVWLTTDERRIPVRMKAKVIIGSIMADLVGGFPVKAAVK